MTESQRPANGTPGGIPPQPPLPPPPAAPLGSPSSTDTATKPKRKKLLITGAVVLGLIVVGGVGNALKGDKDAPATLASTSSPTADAVASPTTPPASPKVEEAAAVTPSPTTPPAPTPTPEPQVAVPNVVGQSVAAARDAMTKAGLTFAVPDGTGDDFIVNAQSLAAGSSAAPGAEVAVEATAPAPELTLGQKNAIKKAKSYLGLMAFSFPGLVSQLEFEGFSNEDATFAAENSGADWNEQAAKKAKSYLDLMGFSRDGLYDQLEFEGFSPEQIEFGLASVGY